MSGGEAAAMVPGPAQLAAAASVIGVDMRRGDRSARWAWAALVLALLVPAAQAAAKGAPLIAAAGDLACGTNNPRYNNGLGTSNSCHQFQTSNLLQGHDLSAVLPLGDLQYDQNGSLDSFLASYDKTWGRWKAVSHSVIGNHEYDDGLGAQGYYDYWDGVGGATGPAGVRGEGWYSYDVGSWHLIALNSNCDQVSCAGNSRQLRWLRDDLHEHRDSCVLAYMHHPHFSSGIYEELGDTRALWKALYRGRADVVLNGHDHIYERFAPSRPSGVVDPAKGITQFTVGTGGYFLFPVAPPDPANSEFVYNDSYGVMFMRLARNSFGWSFVDVSGNVIDHGKRLCFHATPRLHSDLGKRRDAGAGHGGGRADTGRRASG